MRFPADLEEVLLYGSSLLSISEDDNWEDVLAEEFLLFSSSASAKG